jgi:hypothetical protein
LREVCTGRPTIWKLGRKEEEPFNDSSCRTTHLRIGQLGEIKRYGI